MTLYIKLLIAMLIFAIEKTAGASQNPETEIPDPEEELVEAARASLSRLRINQNNSNRSRDGIHGSYFAAEGPGQQAFRRHQERTRVSLSNLRNSRYEQIQAENEARAILQRQENNRRFLLVILFVVARIAIILIGLWLTFSRLLTR